MAASHALAALAIFCCAVFIQAQDDPDMGDMADLARGGAVGIPTLFGGMPDGSGGMDMHDFPDFDLHRIPFGEHCTPGQPMGDMMGGDMMEHPEIPCLKCGCDEDRVRCHLTPGGEMCSKLQGFRQKLHDACEAGDMMEATQENPCGCKCNDDGEWQCFSMDEDDGEPNSKCLFLKHLRFIDLPPTRVKDLSVLYPQSCETEDDGSVLIGHYEMHDNCKICMCVDGLWKCKQNDKFCDEDGMLKPETVACSAISGPLFPLGTYAQNGKHYRMCMFGWWQDANFVAAVRKPGKCPAKEMPDMEDKPMCEEKEHECVHDIHCQGQKKCCFGPCGGACIMPEMHEEKEDDDDDDDDDDMPGEIDWEKPERDDYMQGRDKWEMKKQRPEPCILDNGDKIPTGRIHHASECETCVCLNGELKCYKDDNCGMPPSCSCGPPGTDMPEKTMNIPFGTLWNVNDCASCVCLDGHWQCHQGRMCKSSTPQPKPCMVSEAMNKQVPTGFTSSNGCCVCLNGMWTCDSPDCNADEQFQAEDCKDMDGNVLARNGAYMMKDCKLCACVNGKHQCNNICDKDKEDMMEKKGEMVPAAVSEQYMMLMRMKKMCPEMMVQCPALEERKDFCQVDGDCGVAGATCCSNGCFKLCMKPSDDGTPMECPATGESYTCPDPAEPSQCNDDSDCKMEGAVCCRDWHGCFGKCVMPPQPKVMEKPKKGLCPLRSPPPHFGQIPFPWDDARKMMMGDMDMPPMGDHDGDRPPMGDGERPPMGDGDRPAMGDGGRPAMGDGGRPPMGGDRDGQMGEVGDMERDQREDMGTNKTLGLVHEWLRGECRNDSACDGDMKCCGTVQMKCMDPSPQPEPAQCTDSNGVKQDHGTSVIGERNPDYDICLVCMCLDGEWLCEKLSCTAEEPQPTLADCKDHGSEMGDMVPTGTADAVECYAFACFNGHWIKRILQACLEAKKGKEGMCPRVDPSKRDCEGNMMMPQCNMDKDCDGDMKCCFDGCTLSCANPKEVHHGQCPKPSLEDIMMRGACEEDEEDTCHSDGDCADGTKCCSNGCHRICKEAEEKPMPKQCTDPYDPTAAPYSTGEIRKDGDCNMCVCVGSDWVCSAIADCTEKMMPLPCELGHMNKTKTVPSGTLHTQSCLHSVCLNGEWHQKLSRDCCPMVPKPCMSNGKEVASGSLKTDPESCSACICLHGIMTCKMLDKDMCALGEVTVPSCWHGEMEYLTGEIVPKMDKKCACFFGLWRCASKTDMRKELDMKQGECPAIFSLLEGGKSDKKSMGMMDGESDGMRGEGRHGRGGMWDERGLPGRDMDEESDRGLIDTVRDWLAPPETHSADESMDHLRHIVDFVQRTKFDGCHKDDDCNGDKICCGSSIGGTCSKPEPEESLPLPCVYDDKYYAHGAVKQAQKDGMCKACACVHGMWQCVHLECQDDEVELDECAVGTRDTGLTVASGAQQFLQCQLCVCLHGDWKCSDRACPNEESEALCPAELPPNVYVGRDRCRSNDDCDRKDKCCEYENYGRVCVPMQLPNEKRGECPAEVNKPCTALKQCLTDSNCPGMMKCCRNKDVQAKCEFRAGAGVCIKPSSRSSCPGGGMGYVPCGHDVNPCDHVGGCASDSTLTCEKHECGSCKAMFYDESMMPSPCPAIGQMTCEIKERRRRVQVGHSYDKPKDPCQICVCTPDGKGECTKDRNCGKQERFQMKFDTPDCSALDDEETLPMKIQEILSQLAAFANIDVYYFKDPDMECRSKEGSRRGRRNSDSSYELSVTLVEHPSGQEEDGIESIDVSAVLELIENGVDEGLHVVIDDEPHMSVPDSFKKGGHEDMGHFHMILVIAMAVVLVAGIIAITVCVVKKRNKNCDQEKA